MRGVDRQLKKTGRDIERDRRELEKEEKKLVTACFMNRIKQFHLLFEFHCFI